MSYKVVKDSLGNIIAYGPNEASYSPLVGEGCTLDTIGELPVLSSAKKKSAELTALAVKFKVDDVVLQMRWLAASVVDGDTEVAKKAAIAEDRLALSAQFKIDTLAIIAKYA